MQVRGGHCLAHLWCCCAGGSAGRGAGPAAQQQVEKQIQAGHAGAAERFATRIIFDHTPCHPSLCFLSQIVKKKVQTGDDGKGRFAQAAKEYVRTVDRVKKAALKT